MIDRRRRLCRRHDGTKQDTVRLRRTSCAFSSSYSIRFPPYTPTGNAVQITPVKTVRPSLHGFSWNRLMFSSIWCRFINQNSRKMAKLFVQYRYKIITPSSTVWLSTTPILNKQLLLLYKDADTKLCSICSDPVRRNKCFVVFYAWRLPRLPFAHPLLFRRQSTHTEQSHTSKWCPGFR